MEQLTPRQLDIVRRLLNTNRWIANDLGISVRTVKGHITAIAKCLELPGVRQKRLLILRRCLAAGFVRDEELIEGQKRVRWWS